MKIGLALGAGAARGWAHIGIIEALEELGLEISVISGCSIGAYVGSAYASGKLPELKEWAFSLSEWQVLSLLGVGMNKGGLASGDKVFIKHSEEFCAATFEEMQKPFALTATDLSTGREKIFNQGEVKQSIRASCAIPALFPPVAYEDRWLVDGAVVNPVPVNLCKQLGADFVIAVNLSADFRPEMLDNHNKEHIEVQQKTDDIFARSQSMFRSWFSAEDKDNNTPPGIMTVMSTSLDIMQARVTRSRLAGDPPHVLIEPHLRDVSLLDFHRAEEMYAAGREAVNRLSEQILYQFNYIKKL